MDSYLNTFLTKSRNSNIAKRWGVHFLQNLGKIRMWSIQNALDSKNEDLTQPTEHTWTEILWIYKYLARLKVFPEDKNTMPTMFLWVSLTEVVGLQLIVEWFSTSEATVVLEADQTSSSEAPVAWNTCRPERSELHQGKGRKM